MGATLQLGKWHLDKFGVSNEPAAINEALADYFSSALEGDPHFAEYAAEDIGLTTGYIRTLDNTETCIVPHLGEAHAVSTLFSGALWKARASLDPSERTAFDAALYKAMRSNPSHGDVGYADVGNLFVETLHTDLPSGEAALRASLTERGIFPGCSKTLLYAGMPIGFPGSADTSNMTSPGWADVGLPDGSLTPSGVQFHFPLPSNATAVSVSFSYGGKDENAPAVLAKFDGDIAWNAGATSLANDADVVQNVHLTGKDAAAIVPIKSGASYVTLQIANRTATLFTYDNVAINVDPGVATSATPSGTAEPAAKVAPPPPASGAASKGASGGTSGQSSGCSVTSRARNGGTSAWLGFGSGFAWFVAWRRRLSRLSLARSRGGNGSARR